MCRAGAGWEHRVLNAGWRLIVSEPASGASNMAADAALLDAAASGEGAVRLYGWSTPTVSIGRHQPDPDPVAAERLESRGIDWVRRPTGGRAVYHGRPDEELTYAVAAPLSAEPFSGSWRAGYDAIHAAIAAGLRSIGVTARVGPGRSGAARVRPGSRLACFAASVPGEITVGGRKLVGSAQRRTRGAVLQHGSIPLAGDPAVLDAIWPGSLDPDRVTTVSRSAGRPIPRETVITAIVSAIEARLGARVTAEAERHPAISRGAP